MNCLNTRYRKIYSSEIPITEQSFGDNCTTKLKNMGDMNKHSLRSLMVQSSFNSYKSRSSSLNFRDGGCLLGKVTYDETNTCTKVIEVTKGTNNTYLMEAE